MDYDLIVIGSGPGGYVAAIRAAQLGMKVACIEKDKVLGGTCLNVGCIPSKSLLHSTELYYKLKSSKTGIEGEFRANFSTMMSAKNEVVQGFNKGIEGLFKKNKIEWIKGHAQFTSPATVVVEGKTLSARYFIIATGSEPSSLPFLPFDEKRVLSSTGALALTEVPKSLIVIGAGIIGVELGSVYSRLGAKVTFLEFLDRICPTLDETVSPAFQKILEKQGLTFHLSHKVEGANLAGSEVEITASGKQFKAEKVLVAIGRRPYLQGLGIEAAGIALDKRGSIAVNGAFRTSQPHIYGIGDAIDGPMLAHKASEEGVAVAEIIAGGSAHVHYLGIPSVVYTDPEAAAVGVTEEMAKQLGREVLVGQFPFKANSRARCSGDDEGFVKLIVDKKSRVLIGCHILGAHAGELIAEPTYMVTNKGTLDQLLETSHAHPTLSEAIREAAFACDKRALHI